MRKFFIVTLGVFTAQLLAAQNIVLNPTDTVIYGEPDVLQEADITLTNNGDAQVMSWKRMVNDIPAEWTSSVCDFNLCWAPSADEPGYPFNVDAGQSGTVYVKFDARNYYDGDAHPTPGCGTVEIAYYSTTDSADYNAYGVYEAKLGVDENCLTTVYSPNLDNSFIAYPNPARYTLNVLASYSADITRVELLNIVGQVAQSVPWTSSNGKMVLDIRAQPEGIYFVRFINNRDETVYTQKVSIVR